MILSCIDDLKPVREQLPCYLSPAIDTQGSMPDIDLTEITVTELKSPSRSVTNYLKPTPSIRRLTKENEPCNIL